MKREILSLGFIVISMSLFAQRGPNLVEKDTLKVQQIEDIPHE